MLKRDKRAYRSQSPESKRQKCVDTKSMFVKCAGSVPGPQPGPRTGIYQAIQASKLNQGQM